MKPTLPDDRTTEWGKVMDSIRDPLLPPHERKRIAYATLRNQTRKVAIAEAEIADLREQIAAFEALREWGERDIKCVRLEKNDCTRLHQFADAAKRHLVVSSINDKGWLETSHLLSDTKVFVVQHDWARAFTGAADYDASADYRLPYQVCVFEFVISGVCCLVFTEQADADLTRTIFVQSGKYWICWEDDGSAVPGALLLCDDQIRAIAVALEAQIATHDVVRAPAALNAKRSKAGKLPLYDYHVVSLAHRTRVAPLGTGTHRTPRLHFRRGHWRHYEDHNTWIKWTLVGDPDLGFIDKHYTL